MIRSDKQYQAAKKQLVSLRKALAAGAHAKAPEAVIMTCVWLRFDTGSQLA